MAATATARWEGTIDEGTGAVSTGTGLTGTFTKASRFADGAGTNPEELIGAAHAGCFSQFLALLLTKNETPPTSIETTAKQTEKNTQLLTKIERNTKTATGGASGAGGGGIVVSF